MRIQLKIRPIDVSLRAHQGIEFCQDMSDLPAYYLPGSRLSVKVINSDRSLSFTVQYQTGKRDTQAKQPHLSSIEFDIKIFC